MALHCIGGVKAIQQALMHPDCRGPVQRMAHKGSAVAYIARAAPSWMLTPTRLTVYFILFYILYFIFHFSFYF
eukprot:SAG31_NODE_37257_length_306_cov_0.483092_1_plen_72_part_01